MCRYVQHFHVLLADAAGFDATDDGSQVAGAGFFVVLVHLAHVASFAFRLKRARTPVRTRQTARARPAGAIDLGRELERYPHGAYACDGI